MIHYTEPYYVTVLLTPTICMAVPVVAGWTLGKEWQVWFSTN